ncbi:hypothetical protein MATL_G00200000 [Megalops atlanticus]|uniref:Rho guanine nucleotide exchange factor 11 n=1 Tax=Megalops atlanticus TaxID=7932 RepID=A0A9D3T5A5_MEGAT|nr:hypothetical protein MATL_G00200000 [Megalops atlanticus]
MSLRPPAYAPDRPAVTKQSHLPSPFAAWFSSLAVGDSERKTVVDQQRELMAELNTESTGPGLVQRCVVVQKDQLGFGFTVCGERIKLVQNVRPGGAAVKAGVQEGDRIIKVNGSLVSSMSHQEVVKLIKAGTYVALTLQGPPPSAAAVPLQPLPSDTSPNHRLSLGGEATPPPPPPLPPVSTQRITGPKPLQDSEVQKHASEILRKMLEQEEAELQALQEELVLHPSPSLEQQIQSARRRAHQVKVKIQQDSDGARPESAANYVRAGGGHLSVESSEGDSEACESPYSSPSLRTSQHQRPHTGASPQIIGPEEEEDEDYTLSEMDGPFQDIELLKSRPAHMTVFMRYIFSQLLDPNPLLFFLSVEAYLGASPKDARSLAPQICSHFLDPDAPLKIRVGDEYLCDIESRLQAQEDIRGPLSELQQQVLPEIQDQIQDYRSKQLLGLSALFGEGDLLQLDGDPVKERQVVDKQVTALWEILSKHEEERSAPLASAVLLYLRHSGIKPRDCRVPGLPAERDRWLAFFPKPKKASGTKRDREGEDRRRNPILKYIGKPRSSSQSTFHLPLSPTEVRPGSVRNIIQQFENNQPDPAGGAEGPGPEGGAQRLSTSSLGEQTDTESDVDMEDCGEERPLLHSTSSSASSSSARSLENPTPPFTPRARRRSMEAVVRLLPGTPALDEDPLEIQNWQETVDPQTLSALAPREVDRQAVIYELYTTEASHLRTLRVLDQVFYQRMRAVLSAEQLACIFPNLPQVYELHASLCESMKKLRESPIVQGIGDIMLARFEGVAGAEFQEQVSLLCSQQSQALELIKNKQRKDPRFSHIIQDCESSPFCRRLQLKDLLVSEMQRLTKYPLLLDNIIKHTDTLSPDLAPLQRAQACCRGILQAVNEVVRETEHKQRLSQYQRRLDLTPLERQANPVAAQFKNLDLTTKRMIHEGCLTWRVSKDKNIEVQALLLSDLLVLLQRGPDDRLVLRCPSRWLGGGASGELKTTSCPVVRLETLLVRSVATDNKALYLISTSERQIYELVAGTSSEKNTWKDLLERTISLATGSSGPTNHGIAPSSPSTLDMESSVTSGMYQSEDSLPEGPDRGSPNDEEGDVETLRQLIFRDLEEDGWSHDSDDTPTNETANERSPFTEGVGSETPELSLSQGEPEEAPPLQAESSAQVVRKAKGVGSASIPDFITDDVSVRSSQSDCPQGGASAEGNTFYLVMPQEPGETHTDEGVEPPHNTAQPSDPRQEMTSPCPSQQEEGQWSPSLSSFGQSQDKHQRHEADLSQSQIQTHLITNVEEIFNTIEELMAKLRQLREIEAAHHQLLRTLTYQDVNQVSADRSQTPPADVGTAAPDRGAGDGKEGSPAETLQPEVQSTGF